MDGGRRGLACVGAWALSGACGPTLVDGPDAIDSGNATAADSGAASSSASVSAGETISDDGHATATGTETVTATITETVTETVTDTVTETVTETLTATLDDSGTGDVPTSSVSMVNCQDDGTVAWLVEVYVMQPIDGCDVSEIDPTGILLVGIDEWDGESGSFVIGDGTAVAVYGVEQLTGTFNLEVSSPYHPSTLDYAFTGPSAQLVGDLDLSLCSYVNEPPCDVGTTG